MSSTAMLIPMSAIEVAPVINLLEASGQVAAGLFKMFIKFTLRLLIL